MGAWIETLYSIKTRKKVYVAPYVGAWIETAVKLNGVVLGWSHPMWVRGLKQY